MREGIALPIPGMSAGMEDRMIWVIVDVSNRCSIFQIGFETKAAAEHYIAVNGNPAWKAEAMSVYSEADTRKLWPHSQSGTVP